MAYQLVQEVIPACIGMTEPIAPAEASKVTNALYFEVFELLKPVFQLTAGVAPLEVRFDSAIVEARRALHVTANPSQYSRWTLPLLFVTRRPLRVQRVSGPSPEVLQTKFNDVVSYLRGLPPTTPPAARAEVLDILASDPNVPRSALPDVFGNLADSG
jgi:hypothetical protein